MKSTQKTLFATTMVALMGALMLIIALPSNAQAQEVGNGKNFGLGIALGSPSGLTGKYYLNQKNAIQATLGLGFADGNHLNFSMDYLYHLNFLQKSDFRLDGYAGIGGFLWSWFDDNEGGGNDDKDSLGIGVRVPFGLSFIFAKVPVDIYVEIAPGFSVIGRTGFFISGALGFRYYF
jgi:Protein of unknown function (DUF3996)